MAVRKASGNKSVASSKVRKASGNMSVKHTMAKQRKTAIKKPQGQALQREQKTTARPNRTQHTMSATEKANATKRANTERAVRNTVTNTMYPAVRSYEKAVANGRELKTNAKLRKKWYTTD